MTQAAVYVRISEDRDGGRLGVARQERDCRALAEQRGWTVGEVYCDNDISATSGKPRPGYRRLLVDIGAGLVSAVVVWDLDRLHRRPAELEEFIGLADRRDVQLASVGGDADLSTVQGRMIARIKGAVGKAESEQLARRVRRKQLELADAGKPTGGLRPFGYEPDRVAINEKEAQVIRDCARSVLAGDSLRSIAAGLTQRRIATVTGRPWSPTTLRAMLCRPRLAGLREHQGQIHGPAMWEPILDRDTWEAVRAVLQDPQRARRHPATRRHLLTGIAVCGVCSSPVTTHSAGQRRSLATRTAYAHEVPGDHAVYRAVGFVDDLVERVVIARLSRPDAAEALGRVQTEDRGLGARISMLQTRLQQVAEEFATDPDFTPEQLKAMTRQLRVELDKARIDLDRRHRQDPVAGVIGADAAERWKSLSLARQRAVIATLLERIVILPARRGRGFNPETVEFVWRT